MYKVVKEALKKSKKNSLSVLLGDSKQSRSGSQIEEGEVQTLVNNWRNHPLKNRRKNLFDNQFFSVEMNSMIFEKSI